MCTRGVCRPRAGARHRSSHGTQQDHITSSCPESREAPVPSPRPSPSPVAPVTVPSPLASSPHFSLSTSAELPTFNYFPSFPFAQSVRLAITGHLPPLPNTLPLPPQSLPSFSFHSLSLSLPRFPPRRMTPQPSQLSYNQFLLIFFLRIFASTVQLSTPPFPPPPVPSSFPATPPSSPRIVPFPHLQIPPSLTPASPSSPPPARRSRPRPNTY